MVGLIASGICLVTSYIFVGKPYLERRSMRSAQEQAKILIKSRKQQHVSMATDTSESSKWWTHNLVGLYDMVYLDRKKNSSIYALTWL